MLHERELELDVVADALRAAEAGHGHVLVVSGPVGIGKSELLAHLPAPARRHGARVLAATGAVLEQDFTFGVVRQLLEAPMAAADAATRDRWFGGAAESARLLFSDDPMGPPGDRDDDAGWDDAGPVGGVRRSVLDGLVRLLDAMSEDQPLLLLVDDLQWADTASLRSLGYLANRMADPRVTLVATVREGDPGAERPPVREVTGAATRTLWLGPLSVDGVRRVVRDEFGEDSDEAADEAFQRSCHAASGGNPMFLKALLADMRADRGPGSPLRDRLTACLATQPGHITTLAKAVAVLGEHGDAELAGALADLDPPARAEAFRLLHRLGLVTAGAAPRFAHPAVTEAVEQVMTAADVDHLHRRAAELRYDAGHPPRDVAGHLLAVTGECAPWAVDLLRAAAEAALVDGAPRDAARYLRRALLDLEPSSPDRAALLVELATAEVDFDPAAALLHMAQGVPNLESAQDKALALVRLPPVLLASATQPVLDVVSQVADELTEPHGELRLCLEARLRHTRFHRTGELADAVERLRGLGPDVPLATRGERELAAVLLHAGALTGDIPAERARRLGLALLEREPASGRGAHAVVPLVVTALLAAGPAEDVRSWLDAALDRAAEVEAVDAQATIGAQAALVLLWTGKTAEARALAATVVGLTESELVRTAPSTAPYLAPALVAIESDDAALASRVLARCARLDSTMAVSWLADLVRAWLAARAGSPAAALEHLLDCGRRLDLLGWRNPAVLPWRSWAAALQHTLGQQSRALELAQEEHRLSLRWGAPTAVGRSLRVLGMITDGAAGVELLREAAAVLEDSGNAVEIARVSAALRQRGRGATRRTRAHPVGVEAWFGAGSPTSTTLTKAERRVANLAAAGSTNHEIAKELGVSSRAVEKHLTNSYRKLGVVGRSGLEDALAGLPT
ncbi:helix-turn-helix transcriptional regulator [Actinokineospora sp. G85]|uniref:helix-turn-helix transcriptional regulator n=1 Tax=Actinokineospora sp. G85 TaxID=3406626 RepID=UPI003C787549